jgi:hypothetical protein
MTRQTLVKLTPSEIETMQEDELIVVNERYELGIDLDAYNTTHRKRNVIIARLQEVGMLDYSMDEVFEGSMTARWELVGRPRPAPAGRAATRTTNYVLYIAYDGGVAFASVWPSIADVEANLGGLTGGLLKPGNPFPPPAASFAAGLMKIGIVDCRIIECAAAGSTSVWFAPFTST